MAHAWLSASAAAFLAASPALIGSNAHAQSGASPSLGLWPTITRRAAPPALRPSLPPTDADTNRPVAPIRRAEADAEADGALNGDMARPAALDAASDAPAEPALPHDGLLQTDEQSTMPDGADAGAADVRSDEDRLAFAPTEPTAGYDPSIFSIELDPLLDRRPQRFTELDPFAATGIKIGSFLLFPEAEIGIAAFNNLFRTSSDRRSDVALQTAPAARLVSTWGVHALELGARGLASFHDEYPSEDGRAWAIDARGRLDITRQTNVDGAIGREVTQETRGTINSRATPGGRADVTTDRAAVALNHRFNRLRVQLRGAMAERDYSAEIEPNGSLLSNNDRDSRQHELALRATWEFKPELSLFGEAGTDNRDYRTASFSDGIRRNSAGERYRAGVSFGTTGAIVRGEAAIGYLEQRFEERQLSSVSGVILDANLGWRITGLTSLLLTARTDLGESTVAGSGGAFVRSAGAEVRHAFRRNVVGSAGVRVTRADYAGVDLVEQDVATSLGLDYFLSREVSVFGRYAHIDYTTTNTNSDYTADEFRFGVRVRR